MFDSLYDECANLAYRYCYKLGGERRHEIESIIIKSPKYAYMYAHNIIKGHWIEAELTIILNPEFAFRYSYLVMKERWFDAEPVILGSEWADFYVKLVIKSGGDSDLIDLVI